MISDEYQMKFQMIWQMKYKKLKDNYLTSLIEEIKRWSDILKDKQIKTIYI